MRVLGIDPGSLNLGWGLIELDKSGKPISVRHGCLQVSRGSFIERLPKMHSQLKDLLQMTQPQVAVVESIFLGKSVDSAFKLGHIRGLCLVESLNQGAEVVEYTPRTVKKQITGSGAAEKRVVQQFVWQHLKLTTKPVTEDASDALALALCHVFKSGNPLLNKRLEM